MGSKSYSELITLPTMKERYKYLRLDSSVGDPTFGSNRYLNQLFYASREWHDVRREVILRDDSCDLGIVDYLIYNKPVVHHINPITMRDIEERNFDKLLDPENLITTSYLTHQAIHFGDETLIPTPFVERRPGDTCLWRQ